MNYHFPKVEGGYRYNLLKRCLHEVGIEPVGCHDSGEETIIVFDRELSKEVYKKLAALMYDNPTFPPKSEGTVFQIIDIGEKIQAFCKMTGFDFRLYCSGKGTIDTLELHCKTKLNDEQVDLVKQSYAKLISVV